ncbi:MAG TPA: restriction endonuclease [Rhodanobacteraceae bacterium]|nr:restriction endonuclease [Rhodanobacteraceae bacterium]
MTHMWMVRAERGGILFDQFESESMVAIGWTDMGNMERLRSRDDFAIAAAAAYPNNTRAQTAASAGQAYRFVREMRVGDGVITYSPEQRVYLVGEIRGEYKYEPHRIENDPNVRDVEWTGRVPRDLLTLSAKNSLGAISTLFLVPPDVADEIKQRLKEGMTGNVQPQATPPDEDTVALDELYKENQNQAFELTKDRITKLGWDDMQQLVAGLLRAMGYKTRVSPTGADRGKDIVASPDGLGLSNPRIVVEVKHRPGSQMGSAEVRSFLGGRHKDDKGLYVSTGGFSKDARYEADRASIPLTLMDLDDLVEAILDHYEEMDPDAKQLIPLRKVYWPS